jgi:hypothetical protein
MDIDNMFKWVFGILVIALLISTIFNIFLVYFVINKTEYIEIRPEVIYPVMENNKTNWRIENNVAIYEERRYSSESKADNRSVNSIAD